MRDEYINLCVYVGLSAILSVAIFLVSYVGVIRRRDREKVSAYECGFHPFDEARMQFTVKFYLVGILFIIFDLEITFLFPWSLYAHMLGVTGFLSVSVFIILLFLGFLYEWKRGILDWH